MKKIFFSIVFIFWNFAIYAADLPDVDVSNQENNQAACVDRAANNCINTACITSEDLNCQDNCRKAAQDKCEAARAE